VSDALPVVSGQRLVKALERDGWQVVRLMYPDRRISLTVPLHRELKRGMLAGVLIDAGLDPERLRRLLRVAWPMGEARVPSTT
jgi:predicted RNA binding protein YcfA (HicA-like mRNA interferase family)